MSPKIRKWISISTAAFFAPVLLAGDLSRYRDFQLGMDLSLVEKRAEVRIVARAETIHRRPALMQDLSWRPRGSLSPVRLRPTL